MIDTLDAKGAQSLKIESRSKRFEPGTTFHVNIFVTPEPVEGGYSVSAPSLPGAFSQGETYDEAVENITEALRGLITEYVSSGKQIPWATEDMEVPADAMVRWILVNVR